MNIMIPIKKQYADSILKGDKRFEFRKHLPKIKVDDKVYLYVTAPIKKVVGYFTVDYTVSMPIDIFLWMYENNKESGITKEELHKYFKNKEKGYAIKIKDIVSYVLPLELNYFNVKYAPQNYIYITEAYYYKN